MRRRSLVLAGPQISAKNKRGGGGCAYLGLLLLTCHEVPEPADRRLQTRRMPLWNALDCFITENLVLTVMYDSVHSVLVKQHGYIQWTNCTKNTLLGN